MLDYVKSTSKRTGITPKVIVFDEFYKPVFKW
jgi:hypothetical protein